MTSVAGCPDLKVPSRHPIFEELFPSGIDMPRHRDTEHRKLTMVREATLQGKNRELEQGFSMILYYSIIGSVLEYMLLYGPV